MKLYIKQKVFSWKDRFNIMNENGESVYSCIGEFWSITKKLHLYDLGEKELAFIQQKFWTFLPKYFIYRNEQMVATVKRTLTLFRHHYVIPEFNWEIQGDFWDHSYSIKCNGNSVADVSKKWFAWGDTYEIDIADDKDVIDVLSVVLVIDADISQERAAASSGAS